MAGNCHHSSTKIGQGVATGDRCKSPVMVDNRSEITLLLSLLPRRETIEPYSLLNLLEGIAVRIAAVILGASANAAVVGAIAPGTAGAHTTRDGMADSLTLTTTTPSPSLKVIDRRRRCNSKGREPKHCNGRDDGNAHLEGKDDKWMDRSK